MRFVLFLLGGLSLAAGASSRSQDLIKRLSCNDFMGVLFESTSGPAELSRTLSALMEQLEDPVKRAAIFENPEDFDKFSFALDEALAHLQDEFILTIKGAEQELRDGLKHWVIGVPTPSQRQLMESGLTVGQIVNFFYQSGWLKLDAKALARLERQLEDLVQSRRSYLRVMAEFRKAYQDLYAEALDHPNPELVARARARMSVFTPLYSEPETLLLPVNRQATARILDRYLAMSVEMAPTNQKERDEIFGALLAQIGKQNRHVASLLWERTQQYAPDGAGLKRILNMVLHLAVPKNELVFPFALQKKFFHFFKDDPQHLSKLHLLSADSEIIRLTEQRIRFGDAKKARAAVLFLTLLGSIPPEEATLVRELLLEALARPIDSNKPIYQDIAHALIHHFPAESFDLILRNIPLVPEAERLAFSVTLAQSAAFQNRQALWRASLSFLEEALHAKDPRILETNLKAMWFIPQILREHKYWKEDFLVLNDKLNQLHREVQTGARAFDDKAAEETLELILTTLQEL